MASPDKSAPDKLAQGKSGKSIPSETESPAKPSSKKLLFIVIGVLILGAVGGAAWYFTKGGHSPEEAKAPPAAPPKFVALEPFTVNLQHDEGEKFLQIGITLKVTDPELEEKIKLRMPEIRSHLLFLLSSKHVADLMPSEGKTKLAQEITVETSNVLGLPAPAFPKSVTHEAASNVKATSSVETTPSASAPTAAEPASVAAHGDENSSRVLDVLFTSFIIQ
jgi:flagellar protein FliL